ncbi:MAG: DUF1592 domain-containing protein [Myxococcales bacterium]|nr:DUF1592 domain-containing protein [Myxococcales bacterium]
MRAGRARRLTPWVLGAMVGLGGCFPGEGVEAAAEPDAAAFDDAIALDRPASRDLGVANDQPPSPRDAQPDAAPDAGAPTVEAPYAPGAVTLQRLTRRQYANALGALFGSAARLPTDLDVDTPLHGFTTIGAAQLTVAPRAAEQYDAAALDVAHQVFTNATARVSLVGCTPTAPDDACARAYLQRFGRLAWRRPLSDAELTRWVGVSRAVHGTFRDVWAGLEYATAGLLESPNFLYRVELGSPDPARPGWLKLSGYELASRLAFVLWNAPPDDALLSAAARGALDTAAGLRVEAARLLADPRARAAVGDFFAEYFKLDRLDTISRNPQLFPLFTSTLGASMRGEIVRLIDDVVFAQDVDLRAMFDTRATYLNDDLARLYNLSSAGPGFARVELPMGGPRAGILTTAGFLALNAHAAATSPTLRGRFVRQSLLCQEILPPPPGVATNLPEPSGVPQTLRQRLEQHRSDPTCAGCHNLMDPLGFGFENFDSLGVYRTTDNGLPVDPRGEVDGIAYRNAREMAALLRRHPRVGGCIARQLYRYATAHKETDAEAAGLRALAQQFESNGFRFRALALDLVSSDGFRYASQGM